MGDSPISVVYNAIAQGTQVAAFATLAPGGVMVTVAKPDVGERGKDDEQGRRVIWVWGGANEAEHHAFGVEMYSHLTSMLESGDMKPNNIKVIEGGLAAIPDACDEFEKGVSGVKLVVRIRE